MANYCRAVIKSLRGTGRILGQKPDKSLRPCFSLSPLQIGPEILFLQTLMYFFKLTKPLTYFYSKLGKGGKPNRKPYPLPYGLRNSHRNLKSENSQDNAQKPQRSCTFMNSASVHISYSQQTGDYNFACIGPLAPPPHPLN